MKSRLPNKPETIKNPNNNPKKIFINFLNPTELTQFFQ